MPIGGGLTENRGKRLQAQRGERMERNFAHQFDTGGMDRLYVRGQRNVHKKLLIQAAACNLALLMRSLYGVGKPRAAYDLAISLIFANLWLIKVLSSISDPESYGYGYTRVAELRSPALDVSAARTAKNAGLDTDCKG